MRGQNPNIPQLCFARQSRAARRSCRRYAGSARRRRAQSGAQKPGARPTRSFHTIRAPIGRNAPIAQEDRPSGWPAGAAAACTLTIAGTCSRKAASAATPRKPVCNAAGCCRHPVKMAGFDLVPSLYGCNETTKPASRKDEGDARAQTRRSLPQPESQPRSRRARATMQRHLCRPVTKSAPGILLGKTDLQFHPDPHLDKSN